MCTIYLYDQLNDNGGSPYNPPIPIDGYWTLESSPVGYPVLILVDGINTVNVTSNQTVIESQIGLQYNPSVDLNEFPVGLFIFRYHFGNACEQVADLYVHIVYAPCQADDLGVTVCTDQGILQLIDLFQGTCVPSDFGNFTAISDLTGSGITLSNDGDGTNDYIDTDNTTEGVYILTYTYQVEDGDLDCDNCTKEVQLTITVSEEPVVGDGDNVVICS